MEKLSEHQKRKNKLREIILACPAYVESDMEDSVFYAVNIENATRVELRLTGNNLKVMRGKFKAKSLLVRDIDPVKFKKYIYDIVGLKLPE